MSFHERNLRAIAEASKANRAAKERASSPRPVPIKTIFEVLKENKEKNRHLDPVFVKRDCPHPLTGFFCRLCECDQIPKEVLQNAINHTKSPRQDNLGLKVLRESYKFPKSPKSPANEFKATRNESGV